MSTSVHQSQNSRTIRPAEEDGEVELSSLLKTDASSDNDGLKLQTRGTSITSEGSFSSAEEEDDEEEEEDMELASLLLNTRGGASSPTNTPTTTATTTRGGTKEDTGASMTASVFNLVNNVAGAGILALSAGMTGGTGWVPSVLLVVLLGIFSSHSFKIIGEACELTGEADFKVS